MSQEQLSLISGSDATMSAYMQAQNKNAPRVRHADIEAAIAHTEIVKYISYSGQVLRWAVITMKNGFSVTGRPSASVCPENDDAKVGEEVALANAKAELWPLMGFALKQRLHEAGDAA